jgi:hypothetical protein
MFGTGRIYRYYVGVIFELQRQIKKGSLTPFLFINLITYLLNLDVGTYPLFL